MCCSSEGSGTCVGTFGDGCRCPTLPAKGPETAERSLPSQPLIISLPPPCLAPPPPQHTDSSYYLQGSLGTVIGGRWLRGPENTKGTRIPTWSLSTTSPGTARRRVRAGTPELLRRLNQVRLLLSKGSSRLPGFIARSVLEGLRVQCGRWGHTQTRRYPLFWGISRGIEIALQDTGLRRLRPTRTTTDRDLIAGPGREK